MEIKYYSMLGEELGVIEVPDKIFNAKVNKQILYEYVKLYLRNQRQGTKNVKGRSEVAYSTKKIYRQKGTGRARHGAVSAPIFVNGGKALAPKPRDFYVKIKKQLKEKALISALSDRARNNSVIIVDKIELETISTKEMNKILRNLVKEGTVLVVLSEYSDSARKVYLSTRNLPYADVKVFNDVNAYDILKHKYLIITKDIVDILKATEEEVEA